MTPTCPPPESSDINLEGYQRRLAILFQYQPVECLPPIVESIPKGSPLEAVLIRSLCIEMMAFPEDVRRSIVLGDIDHPKLAVIALSVFRCPEDLGFATFSLAHIVGRYVVSPLVSDLFLTSLNHQNDKTIRRMAFFLVR